MGRRRWYLVPSGAAYPPADVYDLNFVGGAGSTQLTAAGFTFTRATTAWDENRNSFASGVPVISSSLGLYVEEARTQRLLNSASPATQTTASLAAGTYVVWMVGTGSVAVSGGASGTATAAAPFSFTLASAATVTVTPSGSVTYFELSNGAFPTTPIVSAGAVVTRNAVTCLATGRTGIQTAGTVAVKFRSAKGVISGTRQSYWAADDGTASNRIKVDRSATRGLTLLTSIAGTDQTTATAGTLADDTAIVCIAAWDATGLILKSTLFADWTSTALAPSATLGTERIGSSSGGAQGNGPIARIARWSTRLTSAQMDAIKAGW